jgi:hypothetical protein
MLIPVANLEAREEGRVEKAFAPADPEAIRLLAGIATVSTHLLEQLATRKHTCNIVREIAAQHSSWPVNFTGIYPETEDLIGALELGKNLPFRLESAQTKKDKLYFRVRELLFKVIQTRTLYWLFQTPDYPEALKVDLPDYASDAAQLEARMTMGGLDSWWRCVQAEFDNTYGPDIYGPENRANLVAMMTELTGREPQQINVSSLKKLLLDRLKYLAFDK